MSRAAVAVVLTLLLPAAVAGQEPESGTYRIFQGASELGRESFRRSAGQFEQQTIIPALNQRLTGSAVRAAGGAFAGFTLTITNAAGDSLRAGYRAVVSGDSVKITSGLSGRPVERTRRMAFDAVLPPQSVVTFAELAVRAQRHDTTFRLMVAGPDTVLPATLRFAGDSVHITFGGLDLLGTLEGGRVAAIEIPAQRVRVVRAQVPESLPPLAGLVRPPADYGAPPGAPYTAREVRIPVRTAGDSFALGCTLTVPAETGRRYPAVITITGSGSQPRDEELWPLVPGYRLFGQVADRLGRAGMAVLRCDDRGVGASGGRADSATTVDLAGDTRAQLAWLRARPEIDSARIALLGHSEGGMIGPMLAAEDPRIAALVILAGPAKPGVELLVDQARWPILSAPGVPPEVRQTRLREAEAAVRGDSLPASPWMRWFIRYDPLPTARRIRQPTLILQGALDRQVSAGQADTLAAAIRQGGNRDVTERVYPRLNHLFLVSETDGSPSEYASLRDVAVPDTVLDAIAAWLAVRLHAGTP